MTRDQYLDYAIVKGLYRKQLWFFTLFTIQEEVTNAYLVIKDNKAFAIVEDQLMPIEWYKPFTPILTMSDTVTIEPKTFINLDKPTSTTVGRALANKLLYVDPFGTKLGFNNGEVSVGNMENIIAKGLSDRTIRVDEYKMWMRHLSYLSMISAITNISATERNVLPPDGIEKFKAQTAKELTEQYGEDWVRDRSKVVIFENKLKDFDTEFLKGDPSLGTFVSGKVKNGARTKMYLTFGAEVAFDKKSGAGKLVYNSLLEGYPKDKENLTNMFNTSRSGSFDRGNNTQKGGSAAKEELRSTASIGILEHADCQAKQGKLTLVGKYNANQLEGRYKLTNGKSEVITDANIYIGQVIELRSPQYCKQSETNICGVCAGESLRKYPNGVPIIMTDVSAILLATSMSAMHFKELKNLEFNLLDTIR